VVVGDENAHAYIFASRKDDPPGTLRFACIRVTTRFGVTLRQAHSNDRGPERRETVVLADGSDAVRAGTRVILERAGLNVVAEVADVGAAVALSVLAALGASCAVDGDVFVLELPSAKAARAAGP
jgi:hypothetical protein